MKILIIINSGLIEKNGEIYIEFHVGKFINELKDMGHSIKLYGQRLNDVNNTNDIFPVISNGISVASLKRKKNKFLNYLLLYARAIPETFKADYVYIFYPNAFKYIGVIAWMIRKRYGLYVRGSEDLQGILAHFLYRKASGIFTVSDYFTNYINRVTRNNSARTIYPMIFFSKKDIVYNRTYKEKKRYNILFLARVTRDKGIFELMIALSRLKAQGFDCFLTIVGDGDASITLYELSKKLNISDNVSFEGAVFDKDKIKEYYSSADFYILPTYHGEGFPRTLYESMIFGTPIITTFVGAISQIMKNGWNCIEITPRSIDSIANALRFGLTNYFKCGEFAKNATETVIRVLSGDKLSHAECLNRHLKSIR